MGTQPTMTGPLPVPPSTAVADVLALRGRTGWLSPPLRLVVGRAGDDRAKGGAGGAASAAGDRAEHAADGAVLPLPAVGAMLGRACTIELRQGGGGFGPLYDLLSGNLAGRVLVIVAPDDDVAVWGALLSTAAAQAGATAVLVAGAVRDAGECRQAGVPLWARAVRTVGPAGGLEVASVGRPVILADLTVSDGDLVVVDADGVVALPASGATADEGVEPTRADVETHVDAADAEAVLEDARAYAAAEEQVAAALAAGTPLRDAYRLKAAAVARLTSTQPEAIGPDSELWRS